MITLTLLFGNSFLYLSLNKWVSTAISTLILGIVLYKTGLMHLFPLLVVNAGFFIGFRCFIPVAWERLVAGGMWSVVVGALIALS